MKLVKPNQYTSLNGLILLKLSFSFKLLNWVSYKCKLEVVSPVNRLFKISGRRNDFLSFDHQILISIVFDTTIAFGINAFGTWKSLKRFSNSNKHWSFPKYRITTEFSTVRHWVQCGLSFSSMMMIDKHLAELDSQNKLSLTKK